MLAPVVAPGPALAIPLDKEEALKLVDAMLARTRPVAFSAFSRADISAGLRARILDPGKIDQGLAGLCPVASVRDSENWMFDYSAVEDRTSWIRELGGCDMWTGGARSGELKGWFVKLGYPEVADKTYIFSNGDKASLEEADRLRTAGHKIALSIDADVLKADVLTRERPVRMAQSNHWVVLSSPVVISNVAGKDVVEFTIFTWGEGSKAIAPAGQKLPLEVFLR